MRKMLTINEERLKKIIQEELGIAREVVFLANKIYEDICRYMEQGVIERVFLVKTEMSEVTVDFFARHFKDIEEYYKWIETTTRKTGYSFEDNTIYLTFITVGSDGFCEDIIDTIQHECQHYWECKRANKSLSTPRYQNITRFLINNNLIVSTIAKILYFSNKHEIGAYVNCTFSAAMKKKKKYDSINDFIKDNSVNNMYNLLKNCKSIIERYDKSSYYFINAISLLRVNGVLNDRKTVEENLNYVIKTASKAFEYLVTQIGKAYTLYLANLENEERGITDFRTRERLGF